MKWNQCMLLDFVFLTTSRATNQFQEIFRNPFEPSTELSLKVNSHDALINSKSSDLYTKVQGHDFFVGSRANEKFLKRDQRFQKHYPEDPAGVLEIQQSSIPLDLSLSNSKSQMDIDFKPGKTTKRKMHEVDNIMSKRQRNQENSDNQFFKLLSNFSTESRKDCLQPGPISTTLNLMNTVERFPSQPVFHTKEWPYGFGKRTESSSAIHHSVSSAHNLDQQKSRGIINLKEDLLVEHNEYISKSMDMCPRGQLVAKTNVPRDTQEEKNVTCIFSPSSKLINRSDDILHQEYTKDPLGRSSQLHHSVPKIQNNISVTSPKSLSLKTLCPEATKHDHERLKLTKDILQITHGFMISHQLQGCHIYQLSKKIEALSNLPRDFCLGKSQLERSCSNLVKQYTGLSSENILPMMKRFAYSDTQLLKYLKLKANIDLKAWDLQSDIYCFGLPSVFPIYIIYIEMFIGIIPTRTEKGLEEILDYPTEMANAVKVYQEFESYLIYPESAKETRVFWKEKAISLSPGGKLHKQNDYGSIVWHCIEVWVEKEHPFLWSYIKSRRLNTINHFVKSVFNNIFFYGIEDLTKQIHKIVENSSNKSKEIRFI